MGIELGSQRALINTNSPKCLKQWAAGQSSIDIFVCCFLSNSFFNWNSIILLILPRGQWPIRPPTTSERLTFLRAKSSLNLLRYVICTLTINRFFTGRDQPVRWSHVVMSLMSFSLQETSRLSKSPILDEYTI